MRHIDVFFGFADELIGICGNEVKWKSEYCHELCTEIGNGLYSRKSIAMRISE